MTKTLLDEIASLRGDVETLMAEKRIFQRQVNDTAAELSKIFGLTRTESQLLEPLLNGAVYKYDRLADLADISPNTRSIHVHFCRMRKKIAPIQIKAIWGIGVYLDTEDLKAIRDKMKGESND